MDIIQGCIIVEGEVLFKVEDGYYSRQRVNIIQGGIIQGCIIVEGEVLFKVGGGY